MAHTALTNLAQLWEAELVAEIDGDDFFDFTVRRPERRGFSSEATIQWPKFQVFSASPAGTSRSFLLLGGFEPHLHWGSLIEILTDYLESAGVKTVVGLRSFPGNVPHSRPAPVNLTTPNIETEIQFGIRAETSKYEGPADFTAVLGARAESLGWRTVELSVIVPYYFRPMPSGAATISLIKVLDHAFGTKTLTEKLQVEAAAEARVVDENLAGNEEAQSMIRELERSYDEGLERTAFRASDGGTTTLPSGLELVEDIERFLREGQKLGDPDTD